MVKLGFIVSEFVVGAGEQNKKVCKKSHEITALLKLKCGAL